MADKMAARQFVIDVARYFVACHYVWGSAGARPGARDGSPHRPGMVYMARPSTTFWFPCLNSACCDGSGEMHICPGRCDYKTVNGGPVKSPDDRDDLSRFLENFHPSIWRSDKFYWGHYAPLTPRIIWGSMSDDRYRGKVVWGEDCTGKQHFDCIGFINYVFNRTSKTRNPNPRFQAWSAEIGQWVASTQAINKGDAAVPGDILFRDGPSAKNPGQREWKHIALLGGDGTVVQAQMSAMGVHADEKYDPANWTSRGRLGDYYFD
jgi:hypothetical protein